MAEKEKQTVAAADAGAPDAADAAARKGDKGFNVETYRREDGWWSFRVDGKESHYRSSNEDGLQRTIQHLLFGRPPGAVTLRAIPAAGGGGNVGDAVPATDAKASWADLPTRAERVAAFLSRGKFADRAGDSPEPPAEKIDEHGETAR